MTKEIEEYNNQLSSLIENKLKERKNRILEREEKLRKIKPANKMQT